MYEQCLVVRILETSSGCCQYQVSFRKYVDEGITVFYVGWQFDDAVSIEGPCR